MPQFMPKVVFATRTAFRALVSATGLYFGSTTSGEKTFKAGATKVNSEHEGRRTVCEQNNRL